MQLRALFKGLMTRDMTPADADQRIILSRHTLKRFYQLSAAGQKVSAENIQLVEDEINLLDDIAKEHPGKVSKLLALVGEWIEFRDSIRATLH
jgi:hypothetical protein